MSELKPTPNGDTKAFVLWRMIWDKSTYRNDSRRNPAVALIRPLIGQYPATDGFLGWILTNQRAN